MESKNVPKYIPSRKETEFIIMNKYIVDEIDSFSCENIEFEKLYNSFVCIIHYVDIKKIRLHMLDLSIDYKTIKKIRINIFSLDEKESDIIIYDTSQEQILEYDIKFDIHKKIISENQLIPKVIIQTSNNNYLDYYLYNSVMSHILFNPDYEYYFFDDNDIYEYILNNCSQYVFECFQSLIPGAYKADFFRYIILNKIGGVYFDCKLVSKKCLDEIIDEHDSFICCKDRKFKALYNAIIITIPNHIILIETIIEMCNRILKIKKDKINIDKYLCDYGIYGITGPTLLYEFAEKHHIVPKLVYSTKTNMIHKKSNVKMYIKSAKYWNHEKFDDNILFIPFVSNYYIEYKNIHNQKEYYQEYFKNKNIII